jgi:dTDP-4-amino-4,6-dideoxygalactose transaminase
MSGIPANVVAMPSHALDPAPIALFVPQFRVEECLAQIRECLEAGWTGLGYKTLAFEAAWAQYTGLPYAHFVASNTVGLHLALCVLGKRLGWQPGDEIISTPLTFVSTNHVLLYQQYRPVFADVDASLCLDLASIAARRTPRTRAVMFVGLGGRVGQLASIAAWCRDEGLALIIDGAHMAGTRVQEASGWRHVGLEADATVFSFQAVKNLPTADSGMVCFARAEDDAMARQLSWLGIDRDTYTRTQAAGAYKWRYDVPQVGYKYHGNSIMAAIGLAQLPYLDADNAYRRQLAAWYREALLVGDPQQARVRLVPEDAHGETSGHLFQVRLHQRDDLMRNLNQHQVFPGVHYRDNTEYPMYADAHGTCPQAHQASQEVMSLPLHLGLGLGQVQQICSLVLEYAQ